MVITRYRPSTVTLALAFWPPSAVAVTVTTVAFVTLGATSTQLFSILAIVPAVVWQVTACEQVSGWTLVRNSNCAWLGKVTAVGTITTLQADIANKISNKIALPLFFYAASLRASSGSKLNSTLILAPQLRHRIINRYPSNGRNSADSGNPPRGCLQARHFQG